jgi:hypothetical protein
MKESLKVLQECAELQLKKSNDYQNPNSRVKQADYYPAGIATIIDIIHAKTLRIRSVLEAMENDPNYKPNFESIEDSGKDLINYASFLVAYVRHGIDGQDPQRDMLNKPKKVEPQLIGTVAPGTGGGGGTGSIGKVSTGAGGSAK